MSDNNLFDQLSFEDLMRIVETQSAEFSSNELTGLISKIVDIKNDVKKKECLPIFQLCL